jgi:tRNA pseudouridine38-40 synthase
MRAFRVAYDGRPYHGFQRQPDVPTVEDAILDALRTLDVIEKRADTPPGYAAAGRTDAGVSAVAQTVAFASPSWLTPAAFNSALPAAVRAWAHAEPPEDFHATHHASARTYTYHLHAPTASLERARTAADRLAGEHDVHNLTPDTDNTVRTLDASVAADGPFLVVRFTAGGFCRQLVRRLVTVLESVAVGDASVEWIDRVLGPESLTGPEGIPPAPAYPLVLTDVAYPDLAFSIDAEAAESAREVFDQRAVERRTGARVADSIAHALGE